VSASQARRAGYATLTSIDLGEDRISDVGPGSSQSAPGIEVIRRTNVRPTQTRTGGRMTRIFRLGKMVVTTAALIATAVLGADSGAGASAPHESPTVLACHGSLLGSPLNKPIVGIASTSDQGGYWLVASDGGIFSYGDALFDGSTGGMALNKPVVGMAATPDGKGYWLVASDGGIFSYGDAQFYGSTGGITLNKPVVGMAATPDGKGYWLVASDGGIFSYGDAQFYGSTGSTTLNKPVVAMASTLNGGGYWLAAADGGIFTFGNATFLGSGPQQTPGVGDFNAFAASTDGAGYIMGDASRSFLLTFGDARYGGIGFNSADTSPLAGLTQPVASANYAYWDATASGGVELNDPGPSAGSGSQTTC
jgi:hypothetical protein